MMRIKSFPVMSSILALLCSALLVGAVLFTTFAMTGHRGLVSRSVSEPKIRVSDAASRILHHHSGGSIQT